MIQSDLHLGIRHDELTGEQLFYLLEQQRYLGNIVIGPTESGRTVLLLKMLQQEFMEMYQRKQLYQNVNGVTFITPTTAIAERVILAAENTKMLGEVIYMNAQDSNNLIRVNPLKGPFNEVVQTFHVMFESVMQPLCMKEQQILRFALTYGVFLAKFNGQIKEGVSVLEKCFTDALFLYQLSEMTIEYLDGEGQDEFDNVTQLKEDLIEWVQNNVGLVDEQIVFKYEDVFQMISSVLHQLAASNVFTEEQVDLDFTTFIEQGGIFIVNTENEDKDYTSLIGTYFLVRLDQTIKEVRTKRDLPIHHLVLDQADKFMYQDFIADILSNQWNTRISVTLALDTLRGIQNKWGEHVVQQVLEYQRNKFAFGGISVYDGRIIEKMIGRKEEQSPYSISKATMIQNMFTMTTIVGLKQEVNEVHIGYI